MQKIEQLTSDKNGVSFVIGETHYAISDTENIKLDCHNGRYNVDFYCFKYHGVINFIDKKSAESLKAVLEIEEAP